MKKLFTILVILLALTSQSFAYQWTLINSNAPYSPRDGAGGLLLGNKMFMIGGWNPMDPVNFPFITNNEVWSSVDGVTWNLEKPNTFNNTYVPGSDFEGRHSAGYVVLNNKMFIVGGDANQGHYQNDVWSSSNGSNWTLETGDVPWKERVLHYAVSFKNKIWVMGGQTIPAVAPAPEKFFRDIWKSSNGKDWEQVGIFEDSCHPLWASAGMIVGSVVFDNKMWVIGGGKYPTASTPRTFYNHVWSSSDGVHWTLHPQTSPTKFSVRQYHNIVVWDNKMWVIAGYGEDLLNKNDVWYSEDGENWTELPNSPFAVRHAATVIAKPDGIYLFAGNSFDKNVWKLTL